MSIWRTNLADVWLWHSFLDRIERDPDRLPVTSTLFRQMFDMYNITPFFAGYLSRQLVSSRTIHYDQESRKPQRYGARTYFPHARIPLTCYAELWYSYVIRSLLDYGDAAPDLSRKVMDWQRFCVWSELNLNTGQITTLALRCPVALKELFCSTFMGRQGSELEQHPMLLHAFLMEYVLEYSSDVTMNLSNQMYSWVSVAISIPAGCY